ncbi:MAG: hypothetical protein N2749_00680 [Clostridia bacterium]|nr:hypothetical protein [Clostridia bacterium]
MPHELNKTAGVNVAGSYDDIVKILKNVSNTGGKLGDTPENIAKKIMIGGGDQTHSFILDVLKFPINKTRLGKNINSDINKIQKNIVEFDMKAGKKIYDALNKTNTKLGKKIGNGFVHNKQVRLENDIDGVPKEIIEIPVAALSRPLEKARDAVLPVAGAFAVTNALSGNKESGDTVRTAHTREELIEKIAAIIDNEKKNTTKKVNSSSCSLNNEIVKKATEALKVAAQKIRELETCNEKLALENQRLYLENIERKKLDEATKLAHEMNEKGLIKKADIESKISELFSMDEQAFTMLKTAIENISYNNLRKDGVDSLTFVVDNNNISYRKTLADSINEAANEIR